MSRDYYDFVRHCGSRPIRNDVETVGVLKLMRANDKPHLHWSTLGKSCYQIRIFCGKSRSWDRRLLGVPVGPPGVGKSELGSPPRTLPAPRLRRGQRLPKALNCGTLQPGGKPPEPVRYQQAAGRTGR